jgi:hypothetical protein
VLSQVCWTLKPRIYLMLVVLEMSHIELNATIACFCVAKIKCFPG